MINMSLLSKNTFRGFFVGVTVHGETVDKFVELLSNSCECKQNKQLVNDIEDLYEEKGPCKGKMYTSLYTFIK